MPNNNSFTIKICFEKYKEKTIIDKIHLVDDFYKKYTFIRPKIALTGLNPHCESIENSNEDEKILNQLLIILANQKLKSQALMLQIPYF